MKGIKNDMSIIEFRKFKAVVDQRDIDYKNKNLDEVLRVMCMDNNYFSNYQDVAFATIVVGGDYGKVGFTMLLAMHIEMIDGSKRHVDEVIGET